MTTESYLHKFPRITIGRFPTPVRKISLDGEKCFWVKDDGLCGSIYGGNKVRKLEYLFAQLALNGKKRVVLQGDAGSHTVTACAIYGKQQGFAVTAVVYPSGNDADFQRETGLLRARGIEVITTGNMLSTLVRARLSALSPGSYLVPLSATTALSTLGYVNAAFELLQQIETGELPPINRIFVPFATGGTVAGLLAGFALLNHPVKIVAIRTTEAVIGNQRSLKRLVSAVMKLIGREDLTENALDRLETLDARFLGQGHGDVTVECRQAADILGRKGLHLDLAFTAKAMAALLATLDGQDGNEILFWNTHDQEFNLSN